ncbi:MAG: type II CRISPR-associated endonuclease Cas1 [Melioribacteraceae bacterium]
MIKRTLYFSNPAYLSKKNEQLVVKLKDQKQDQDHEQDEEKKQDLPAEAGRNEDKIERRNVAKEIFSTIPIEDIGIAILDHQQITITHGLLSSLLDNNAAIVTCDNSHMPNGLFMPLSSNQLQNEKFRAQLEASEPLKKQLWQQTISIKIRNQAALLKDKNISVINMNGWAKKVRSGDPDNYEGRAAAYYWKNFFPMMPDFTRDRFGEPPNNLLNYGYAILRAIVARGLTGSGLLPTFGIHHSNKYNAYCLADDIMEPYRPYVDKMVLEMVGNGEDFYELTPSIKKQLLSIPVIDVFIEGEKSPLMVGVQTTTASLSKCFEGKQRKILYPEMV